MGVYDYYGDRGIQLKIGLDDEWPLHHFKIGDKVILDDGLYVGLEGIILIRDGIFVQEFKGMTSKLGSFLSAREILKITPIEDQKIDWIQRQDSCVQEIDEEWFVSTDTSSINCKLIFRDVGNGIELVNDGIEGPFSTEERALDWLRAYDNDFDF